MTLLFSTVYSLSGQTGFVVEPYIQNVTDSSFHVLFETDKQSTAVAFLAIAEHNTLKADFKQIRQDSKKGLYHKVTFGGLKKGGQYIYRVAALTGSDTLWGPVGCYTVPDFRRAPIVCTVIGDTQNSPGMWGHFSGMIARERPSFLLHTGDMVQYGPDKDDWTDEFFRPAKDLFRFYPLYPVLGNHEMNQPHFYRYFDLPDPEWFYTQTKGNALFVFVDTNRDILPGSKQYRMLEQALASSHEQWKIVLHHHPVYISSGYYDPYVQKVITGDPNTTHLQSLYETYGVDAVFNAHIHNYERTMPIYRGGIDESKGVTYITTGGGGGSLDETSLTRTWYMAETKSRYHYIKMTIWDKTLTVQAIDSAGVEFDRWVRVKERVEPVAPVIDCAESFFIGQTRVIIKNPTEGGELVWKTGDGEYRSTTGKEISFDILQTAVVTAFTRNVSGDMSRTVSKMVVKLPLMPAQKEKGKTKVKAEYYEGFYTVLPDFDKEKPLLTFVSDSLTLEVIRPRRDNHWAARFRGSFTVPATGVYRLLLESYDGSKLLIDGKEIINNDGMHYEIRMDHYAALEKGEHTFEVQYFDFTRRETLKLWMNEAYGDLIDFNRYIKYPTIK